MSLTIGLFGSGVVGTGIVSLIEKKFQKKFIIKKIFTRNINKTNSNFLSENINNKYEYVNTIEDILNDNDINVVIEVLGDLILAEKIIFNALSSGKHVVTANKVMVSKNIDKIRDILKENPNSR